MIKQFIIYKITNLIIRYIGEGNPFYNKQHTDKTKKLIGSKSVNRNWIRGEECHFFIETNKDIFLNIFNNLEFIDSPYKEISDKYFLKTGVRIKTKKIRTLFKEYNFPFLCDETRGKDNIKNKIKNYIQTQKITQLTSINRLNTICMI